MRSLPNWKCCRKPLPRGFTWWIWSCRRQRPFKASELEKLRTRGAALIVSWHDFQTTKDLDGIFERIRPYEPEFIKIVCTARSLADNVVMMHFLERSGDMANMVGLCMGDQGIISRVLAIRAGSVFTFAAATQGEETAPGQIAARTLTDIYRIAQIDTATRVYGVVGNPIKHSLSPLMMNTAFHRETVNAVYLALQTSKLTDLLTVVREVPLSGLSVTMPLKQEVLKHLENMDPISAKVGACNTIVRAHDGKLYGFNTDVGGIVGPLEKRLTLAGAKILVLRGRRCGQGSGFWPGRQGSRSAHSEPYSADGAEAGARG